ncbi:hypothetical protein [Streptomyces fulvoviolaceus]|uniref:hypothetical protein n=1 Tax=Streptomyces fulvoviolaceus TaxID=285535 RepID=UPI000693BA3E|nr:hypothetical protein [Streptomyces fulvoviolaceus]
MSAADGGLDARGLLTQRGVRTDRLVAVRMAEGAAQRLVLSDTSGGRVELDPRVLAADPLLWHRLEQGARRSCGTACRYWRAWADGSTASRAARGILRASGPG